jgi:hypothetical protein
VTVIPGTVADARPAPDAPAVPDGRRRVSMVVAVLIVVGAVGWRRGEYFTGSLDPVVVAKALLSLLALAVAFLAAQRGPRRRLGTASVWFLAMVLVSSVFGALTNGNALAGGVVAVRVLVLGATVVLLLRSVPAVQAITSIATVCGAVAVVATVTGRSTLSSGRLAGGIPAIDPNELALLAGVVVAVLAWRTVMEEAGWLDAVAGAFFLGVVWETGSRTALIMLLAGIVLMATYVRRPQVGLVVGALILVAVSAVAVATTGIASAFAERGGDGTSTLGSRFIAWRAALVWAHSNWQEVFGGGLSVKIIRVTGQYWETQPLDSSWASLLVQTGVLGFAVAVLWVLWVARGARRAPYPHRVLFLGLGLFLVGRSLLESGLFDASPAFLLFFALSLLAEGSSRDRLRSEAAARACGDPE